jgi:predicted DNA-binding protein YlxM (UPF0122 family)
MRLTKKEWKTIEWLHFKEDYTMREISKLYPVSRVALYDHFRNLKRSFPQKLINFVKNMFVWENFK